MKTFYTVRDVEDMHAAGVVEIQTHDDIVITDVAREKAISLGMRLTPADEAADPPRGSASPRSAASAQAAPAFTPPPPKAADADLVMKVKTAVIARLGTDKYNDLLDRIIPQAISQLKK